jgi:hypothetical protein
MCLLAGKLRERLTVKTPSAFYDIETALDVSDMFKLYDVLAG